MGRGVEKKICPIGILIGFLLISGCSYDFLDLIKHKIAQDEAGAGAGAGYIDKDMVSVPAITGFSMGFDLVAEPVHTVASISAFRMRKYEVTYAEWTTVKTWAGSNGYTFVNAGFKGSDVGGTVDSDQEPVTTISWRDSIAWCNALSEKEGLNPVYYNSGQAHITANLYRNSSTGGDIANTDVEWSANGYRLFTEAEWEYAATELGTRTGNNYSGADYDTDTINWPNAKSVAWFFENSSSSTHVVGTKTANSLGIYDMSGNVWELCWDWFNSYSTSSPYTDADTRGPPSGTVRVHRGGPWPGASGLLRTSLRYYWDFGVPWLTSVTLGFRLVRTP